MNISAPSSGMTQPLSLDEAALRFTPSLKFFKLLERHRAAVLNLRARGASCAEIYDFLKGYNILVSEPAIVRFCKKHREEWQRLKLSLEQEGEQISSPIARVSVPNAASISPSQNSTPNPTTPPIRKMRDLRGEV